MISTVPQYTIKELEEVDLSTMPRREVARIREDIEQDMYYCTGKDKTRLCDVTTTSQIHDFYSG